MDRQEIFELIERPERLSISSNDLERAFWLMYPRFRFMKTLAADSKLLDIGASTGGLAHWREWLYPRRGDIKMYGIDLARGEHAHLYAGWSSVNLDKGRPDFLGFRFDGFLASHLIEHLASLDSLLAYLSEVSGPRAWLYFEWPSPKTMAFPKSSELAERGFEIQTCNFFDDNTHQQTYELAEVASQLARHGFRVAESGEINLGIIAEEMMARGRRLDNLMWRQMGFWSAVGWCNYTIAHRI